MRCMSTFAAEGVYGAAGVFAGGVDAEERRGDITRVPPYDGKSGNIPVVRAKPTETFTRAVHGIVASSLESAVGLP